MCFFLMILCADTELFFFFVGDLFGSLNMRAHIYIIAMRDNNQRAYCV